MRGDPSTMRVVRPRTVSEAVALFARHPDAVPLAGGTDFMVGWNLGGANGRLVLDLSALSSWRRIRPSESGLTLGSLATHWQLQNHEDVIKQLPLLVASCRTIGGRQIQTRGTLGGNIANASPAGDTFPALAVYDAVVRLRSSSGTRHVPFLDVFRGVKQTTLAEGELIAAIDVPAAGRPSRMMFRKVGTRQASAISKTVAAGLLWLRRDGTVRELRFALGSMAQTVRRLSSVENFVVGRRPSPAVVAKATSLLEADVDPIDDLRSSRAYRLQVSKNLLRGFLTGGS